MTTATYVRCAHCGRLEHPDGFYADGTCDTCGDLGDELHTAQGWGYDPACGENDPDDKLDRGESTSWGAGGSGAGGQGRPSA